jgi:hypothetical protein
MANQPVGDAPGLWTRRDWLGGVAAGLLLARSGRGQESDGDAAETLREEAKRKGIEDVRVHRSERYLGIGNAPDDFLSKSVTLCEALAIDYMKHFKLKGFPVAEPKAKLHIVALASAGEFHKFIGYNPGDQIGGLYDLDTNHLVLFDNRGAGGGTPSAQRANSVALFHEATHQLTFNTGVLDRRRAVPLVVSEGLAMYGEVRRPDGKTPIGRVNVDRLGVIVHSQPDGLDWLGIESLLDDKTFSDDSKVQMAYAQSWLLIHGLMQQKKTTQRLVAYCAALGSEGGTGDRKALFQEHIGEMARFDLDMMAYARKLATKF